MNRKNITANFDMAQLLLDNVLVCLAYAASCLIYQSLMGINQFFSHFWLFLIFAVIFTLAMSMMQMNNITTFYYTDRIITKTLYAVVVAGMTLGTAVFLYKTIEPSRLLFMIFCVLSYGFVTFGRLFKRILRRAKVGNGYTHVIFIGSAEALFRYESYIMKTAMKIKVDRHIDIGDLFPGDIGLLRNLLIRHSANEVILSSDSCDHKSGRNREILELCEELGITARVILGICELPNSNHFVSSLGPYPVVTYHSVPINKVQLFIKSAIDIIIAACSLIAGAPIMLITAICIKLDSPGPVLFKQKRAGCNGRTFEMYKFRSMYADAEERKGDLQPLNKVKDGLMFNVDNDPRVTKVGAFIRKYSIDELPQLFNVLKHDMSLVGTRPPTLDEVEKYSPEHWRRISIRPGITGMWQVSGRNNIVDFDEVVSLDKKYIDNWSLGLDIMILLRTVGAVLSRRGAE